MGDTNIVFEVDGESLNPLIKVCLGEFLAVSSQNQGYLFGIDLQLDEILQEDAHQVGTDVPRFLLGGFALHFGHLFAGVSVFAMMHFFAVCGVPGIQNDVDFALALVLVSKGSLSNYFI